MANALASYLPKERETAAREALREAVGFLDSCHRTVETIHTVADPDERRILREQLQGAKGAIANWERYIATGCPRAGAR